ncbi:GNAT family N-acetyltransferase [Sphingobacteriales bacterium TSM_CSS]|nr:GNAT family N-acetyltransferase [Sphingobacteriales bacterium TSM_CSS]
MRIIESREKDIDALRNLFFEMRRKTFSWADTSQFQLSDFEKETEGEYVLVAFSEDVLIGFVSVWLADNFIHHLYIDERYQNQNVGSQLLKAVIDKVNLPIRLKCEENNTNAVCFYRQKGFVEKGRGRSEIGTYILFELMKK